MMVLPDRRLNGDDDIQWFIGTGTFWPGQPMPD
jgi:hypothetical protein